MMRRYVVLVPPSKTEQVKKDKEFIGWLSEKEIGWWHWLEGSWLLVSKSEDMDVQQVRESVHKIFGGDAALVLEFANGKDTWSGYMPTQVAKDDEGKNMFDWVKKSWKQST